MKYKATLKGSIHYLAMTHEQVEKYFKAEEAGLNRVLINGAIVQVGSISSFIPWEEAMQQENDMLSQKLMFRCHAGKIHHVSKQEAYNVKAWRCNCPKPKKQIELSEDQEKFKKLLDFQGQEE